MRAIQCTVPRQLAVVDLPKSEPDPHQVVIRIKTCGVCKTDLTIHDGSFLVKFPLVNGHEFVDVIDLVDSTVTEWKVGDRAATGNAELCGYYEPCHNGKPLYYKDFSSYGYNMPGDSAEYVLINHDKVFVLGNKLFFEKATSTEPTAYAVYGANRIAPRFGDSTLMFGTGPTGIVLVQLLHQAEAGRMVITDPHADKLDVLRKYGLTNLMVMSKADPSKHTAEIKAIMPKGFGIVIDVAGAASVLGSCFHSIHMGSEIMVHGVCAADTKIPISPYGIFNQEYTTLDSFAQTHCFDRALEYLENGVVQVKELISHELPLEDYGKGLDYIVQEQACRVIIHP